MRTISHYTILLTFIIGVLLPGDTIAHEGYHKKINLFTTKIQENPDAPGNYFLRGIEYQSHGDFEEARTDFFKVLSLQPGHESVNYNLGYLYLEHNLPDSALIFINRFIDMFPISEKGYECKANIYHQVSDYELAKDNYLKAIELAEDPGIEMYFALSKNYRAAGDLIGAQKCLNDAIEALGDLIPIREDLINIAIANESWSEAHKILDGIILEVQRKESWYVLKAEIYKAENKEAEAQIQYELALEEIYKLKRNHRKKDYIKNLEKSILEQINPSN